MNSNWSKPFTFQLKKRTMERKNSRTVDHSTSNLLVNAKNATENGGGGGAKGEFDDLISALRTGDVFGEDMAKMKRSRKSRLNGNSPPRRNSAASREESRERVLRRQ
ncbi:hypothetical protein LSTR_LSTR007756 [Laodelphax striatellus]|uniref:DAD domain-containing protein n=1 Tax=Laodelphax striatellus TaxID=195883 RepID=A0A482XSM8_LAOST|nr:hypothetical protein LSTR_LSTR007756 [Laodelphax striatellus]